MHRIAGGVLLLLLALPAFRAADDPKDKPATPADQFQALVKEYSEAQQEFFKAYREASDEDKAKMRKEKFPDFGPKFLDLAEKNANDAVALDALVWVATNNANPMSDRSKSFPKALDLLAKNHSDSEKLSTVCERLGFSTGGEDVTAFLLTVLKKNSHMNAQAEACLALGKRPIRRLQHIQDMKKEPDSVKQFTDAYGKDYVDSLQKDDVEKLLAEGAKFNRQFLDTYVGEMTAKRLTSVCAMMAFDTDKTSEALLRGLLEKDARPEVQGAATVILAKLLWRRADELPPEEGQAAAKLIKESEDLYEKALAKYADVDLQGRGTVGKKAKSDLYSLRNLSLGKVAPEIAAEDQDGKQFKLSDYRGKVVLLDFWSEF
jgi:AhpC/TSA family